MQAGFDPAKVKVRLNWGSLKVSEINFADMLKAAELGLIRAEEFRKNVIKFGWGLWEKPKVNPLNVSLEVIVGIIYALLGYAVKDKPFNFKKFLRTLRVAIITALGLDVGGITTDIHCTCRTNSHSSMATKTN